MGKIDEMIDGIILSPLKIIGHEKGDIMHIIKSSDAGFKKFNEAYISKINYDQIKGWKKHFKMTCNFIVPIGSIKIVVYDDRENSKTKNTFNEFNLSCKNYCRLTVPNGLWYGFMGISINQSMLINISDILHCKEEQINKKLDKINYKWKT